MKKVLYLAMLTATLMSCCTKKSTDKDHTDGTNVSKMDPSAKRIELLKDGEYGGREAASNEVITTQGQLDALYKELNWEKAPQVDFEKSNVVALFMGQKNSGGYKIGIKDMEIKNDVAIVTVAYTKPAGMATMALTQPYFIAAINKTGKVDFR